MNSTRKPWEIIRQLLASRQSAELSSYLSTLRADETVRAVFRLSPEEQASLLTMLPADAAADLMDDVPDAYVADILEEMARTDAASIVGQMDSDQAADLLGEIDDIDREEILDQMDDEDAEEARRLISYPSDTAGGLMMTEYLSFRGSTLIGDVIAELAARTDDFPVYHIQQIYIVQPSGKLRGVANLNEIAIANPDSRVAKLIRPVDSVSADAGIDVLKEFFDDHDRLVVPVVDDRNRLLGMVRRRAVYDELANIADEDALKRQGIVGGEELRSMPFLLRARRRLSWLSINIVLNLIAASVIALYQDTLAAVIALAVFLPIVSDMSGCSGNQAVAISMRELTLGIVRPADFYRVWLKEASVGLVNGLVLGILIGLAAFLWKGNVWLALVVGGALALNTLVAVSIGGCVPLLLKSIRVDPAIASGPVLTTVTDMCGFFLVLSLASLALPLIS